MVSCIEDDASNVDAVYLAGICSYDDGAIDTGLTYFQKTLKMDPDNDMARGMQLKAKQLIKKAKMIYSRALTQFKRGHIKEAIDDCTNALDLFPNYVEAISLRAECYEKINEYDECVWDYEDAMKVEKTREIEVKLKEAKDKLNSKPSDPYKILGITKNATREQIIKAYHRKSKKHHPDRHPNATENRKRREENRMKLITEANDLLKEKQNSKKSDQYNKNRKFN